MKNITLNLILIALFLTTSCTFTNNRQEVTKMDTLNSVSLDTTINASNTKVWDIITNVQYAKVLGNEFDKNAFIASEWKKGSKVEFIYEPDKVVASGIISELIEGKVIKVDYDFNGFSYSEKFTIDSNDNRTNFRIHAGPFGEDFDAQKEVWYNWMLKVKELSEKQ